MSVADFAFYVFAIVAVASGGLVVLARIAIYFAVIYGLFFLKKRNWR